MNHNIIGRIWKVGDAIDTDLIVPSRVLTEQDPTKLLAATLELVFSHFSRDVKPGDIIVAGKNFGCGSSREEAVFVLKELGISCIIAENFARIFFRNCINSGLLAVECPDAVDKITKGSRVVIDREGNRIQVDGEWIAFPPIPEAVRYIIDGGGLIPYLQKKFSGKES